MCIRDSILKSALTGKALDMGGWSKDNGGNVQQWDYLAQANQQWKFVLAN